MASNERSWVEWFGNAALIHFPPIKPGDCNQQDWSAWKLSARYVSCRQRSGSDVKTEKPARLTAGGDTRPVAPNPALVPEEIVQDRHLYRDRRGGQVADSEAALSGGCARSA